jgi:hypothetical protein
VLINENGTSQTTGEGSARYESTLHWCIPMSCTAFPNFGVQLGPTWGARGFAKCTSRSFCCNVAQTGYATFARRDQYDSKDHPTMENLLEGKLYRGFQPGMRGEVP